MLILTGPSASGKTEVAKILIEKYKFKKFVTCTTRKPRAGEVNGRDYTFLKEKEFLKAKKKDEFIETTFYNNNYYGSMKKDISEDKVVILDPLGVNAFKEILKDEVVIVFLNTPESIRMQRMISRGDSKELIEARIINDRSAFAAEKYIHVDYMYKNQIVKLEDLAAHIYNQYIKHLSMKKS